MSDQPKDGPSSKDTPNLLESLRTSTARLFAPLAQRLRALWPQSMHTVPTATAEQDQIQQVPPVPDAAPAADSRSPTDALILLANSRPRELFRNAAFLELLEGPRPLEVFPEWVVLLLLRQDDTPRLLIKAAIKDRRPFVRKTAEAPEAATNPESPPQLLARLGSADSPSHLQALVAANPNTPLDLLLKLGARHPRSLLQNPVFPLLLLEDPGFLQKMPAPTLLALLRDDSAPAFLLELVATSPRTDMRAALAGAPATPLRMLEILALDPSAMVRMAVARRSALPGHLRLLLSGDSEPGVLKAAGVIPAVDPAALDRLLEDPRFHRPLALHPRLPGTCLEIFASDPDPELRLRVTQNPSVPAALLQRLARDPQARVRAGVAASQRTPAHVLARLALDEVRRVRAAVAENPHTPDTVVRRQTRDPAQTVRRLATKRSAA